MSPGFAAGLANREPRAVTTGAALLPNEDLDPITQLDEQVPVLELVPLAYRAVVANTRERRAVAALAGRALLRHRMICYLPRFRRRRSIPRPWQIVQCIVPSGVMTITIPAWS